MTNEEKIRHLHRLIVANLSEDEREEMFETFSMWGGYDYDEMKSLINADLAKHESELKKRVDGKGFSTKA